MSIVKQKTSGVIKRVNQMVSEEQIPRVDFDVEDTHSVSPKVLVDSSLQLETDNNSIFEDNSDHVEEIFIDEKADEVVSRDINDGDIFETVVPFEEPVMFEDKNVDSLQLETNSNEEHAVQNVEENVDSIFPSLETSNNNNEGLPDVFWLTESTDSVDVVEDEDSQPTFDEQIDMLLGEQGVGKTRKLEMDKDLRKAA